ncbi:putative oxidoreductase [Helianthus annuus]|uniref:delta(12)-fatty-acid desaturase FAD2 n=1 Tax=Helianthus annuus TaxID=4232 RepID=UPI000B8FF8F6|nr:delta(12)-fatty-acid desaturase FAD2 [Helianthus annuus]KAJ0569090.1 putative oxidoreductase [Helianthus annuus]KAJ0575448.1 putative oxidoreductase [Helianthus annuus]KAJ0583369.1 putative oxidoreductase [Helianthus annuus]KAJ0746106.1 putative oxidoreductase [Helianthus annuus]KAJ0749109.1 putative oxidoreductase [Helianthus annuus]
MDSSGQDEVVKRAPSGNPPFTLGDLKKAVPPHCFNRSLTRSFYYLFRDLFFISLFYYVAATYIIPLQAPLSYVAWPVYWFIQGCVQMGFWLLGHESGHQGFSDYKWVNETVGYFIHTSMLSPYFSWKYSHRRHHSNTASVEYDEAYPPRTKSSLGYADTLFNTPPGRLFRLVILCAIGFLLYVCFNVAGRKYGRYTNHFDPRSPIYSESERPYVVLSDLGLLVMYYVLYKVAMAQGLTWLVLVYFAPMVVAYAILAIITWLNHTHPSLPHYDSTEWNWLRGSLSTVDRDMGFLNTISHHLCDGHVVHHMFSTMPHYHFKEATKAIKPILGEYYQFDDTPVIKAMWREATKCFYVEPDEGDDKNRGVYWFGNKM